MQRNRVWAGVLAGLIGTGLWANSASGSRTTDDPSRKKLIPYYEAGPTRATIIGIQNLSPQEASTMEKNEDVKNIQSFLDGMTLANGGATERARDLIDEEYDGTLDDTTMLPASGMLDLRAAAEKALEKAKKLQYTEHLFVEVSVYDEMGMKEASASLCLAEDQFGYVSIQGPLGTMDSLQGKVISMDEHDIPAHGYVRVTADDSKFTSCGATAPNLLKTVVTPLDDKDEPTATNSQIAVWPIIQDTGMSFFGTEVPTGRIRTVADEDDLDTPGDESEQLSCYEFDPDLTYYCGLIPERFNNELNIDKDGVVPSPFYVEDATTVNTNVFARYDADDDSMIVVWLAHGEDGEDTKPSDERMLNVQVKCEDGTVVTDADIDGNPKDIKVPAPTKLTILDPNGPELMGFTDTCDGSRGVLKIMMPKDSHAGMAFTHISQMMGHYRMNFPAYYRSSIMTCTDADAEPGDMDDDCM